jgi:hypothetical protein
VLRRPFLTAHCPSRSAWFRFKTEDAIGRTMFKKLDYETDVSDFISENVRIECGEIALDVGANIGWYSILFSRLAGGGGSVFAFEPDPLNYKLLVENVKLNAAHSVLPCNLAVGEDCSTKLLFRYPDKNLGRHSLLPINAGAGIEASAVRILKVDVEGYEIFVFRGASEVLRSVKVVVTEYIRGT